MASPRDDQDEELLPTQPPVLHRDDSGNNASASPNPQRPAGVGKLALGNVSGNASPEAVQASASPRAGTEQWSDDEQDPSFNPDQLIRTMKVASPRSPRGGPPNNRSMDGSRGASSSQAATLIDLSNSTKLEGTGRSGNNPSSFGQTALNVARDARERATSVMEWFVTGSVLQTYLSKEAKMMTLLIVLSSCLMMGMSAAVVYKSYISLRSFNVKDESVCYGAPYEEIKTNSVGYSMANIVVGCLFALWLMVRAVRLEKGALLVCVVVVIATVVSRALYFAFAIAEQSMEDDMVLACKISFTIASIVMVAAMPFSFKVSSSFGWRFFTKGVTQAEDVEMMQRHKQLDACAKLDLYITINAFISLFFFVSDNFVRIYGFIVTAITMVFLLALNVVVKKRHYWALYLFYFVCLLMPVFYIYTLATTVLEDADTCAPDLLDCLRANGADSWEGRYCSPPRAFPCAVPVRCFNMANVTQQTDCNSTVAHSIGGCCNEYGRCMLKVVFINNDKPLVLFLVVVGCLIRALTVYVGYRQAQAMDIPSVQEMLRRGERNLKNFQLPTFLTSATFRAAPREDDSYSPSTSLMTPQDRHESLQAA
jgi:hypothetical protein